MLFVGWEGVGLCSFLLIGFWFEMDTLARPSWANSNAAKKAFIANRVGDFGFLIAAFLMFWYMGSLQFDLVFECGESRFPPGIIAAICLFMLIGCDRQIGADPALRLAPGCDGRPDPGLGPDPCRDHGHGRRLSHHPLGCSSTILCPMCSTSFH